MAHSWNFSRRGRAMKSFSLIATVLAVMGTLGMPNGFALGGDEPPQDPGAGLKLGQERIADNEESVIKELVAVQLAIQKKVNPDKRGQHPKQHGCVEAEFVVSNEIPTEYRFGLFKESRTYKAKVRFSNGGQMDDAQADVHGMAVKVLGVEGPRALGEDGRQEQDFVLIDSESFFAPDAKIVLDFLKAQAAAATNPMALGIFMKDNPATAKALQESRKIIASPLVVKYASTVPFKFGDGAVKYVAIPAKDNELGIAKAPSRDFLKETMAERLKAGMKPVVFDLCVVPQTHPSKTPIENPMIFWDATPVRVATITIGPQTFDTPERMRECEDASFDPWHALADHRPLGNVNRARKAVYEASLKARREAQGRP